METFNQNGVEVFVIQNAIDLFSVRPQFVPLIVSDFVELRDSLQNVAMATQLMKKILGESDASLDYYPAEELIWIADSSLDADERVMVIMDKAENDEGGYSYNAQTIREVNQKGDKMRQERDDVGEVNPKTLNDIIDKIKSTV